MVLMYVEVRQESYAIFYRLTNTYSVLTLEEKVLAEGNFSIFTP